MRCSEPGVSVVVAIVASRAPGIDGRLPCRILPAAATDRLPYAFPRPPKSPHHPGPLLPSPSPQPGEEGDKQKRSSRVPSPGRAGVRWERGRGEGLGGGSSNLAPPLQSIYGVYEAGTGKRDLTAPSELRSIQALFPANR